MSKEEEDEREEALAEVADPGFLLMRGDADADGEKLLTISEENEFWCVWTELDEPATSYGEGPGRAAEAAVAPAPVDAGLTACWAAPMSDEPYDAQSERATSATFAAEGAAPAPAPGVVEAAPGARVWPLAEALVARSQKVCQKTWRRDWIKVRVLDCTASMLASMSAWFLTRKGWK